MKSTTLVTSVLRQFMIKRLFRLLPPRTYARIIRRIGRVLRRLAKSNLNLELSKLKKKEDDASYEKALFEEIMSSTGDTPGPLLRTLLYTGFETMPLLDQTLGNLLFRKNRKIRPSRLLIKSPKLNQRLFIVRHYLRETAL